MVNIKSAKKKIRKDKKRTERNKLYLKKIRDMVKKIKRKKDNKKKEKLIKEGYSIIDKAAKEKIIHKNRAARLKSLVIKLTKAKIK